MAFEVLCCMKSWDSSVYNHLMPIALHPKVTKLWIVRHKTSEYGEIPKAEYILTPAKSKPVQWFKIYSECKRVAARDEIKVIVTFNPVPYGMLAYLATQKYHKPTHIGFIGSDWNKYSQGMMKSFLLPRYKKADFITVPGSVMKSQMTEKGIQEEKISLLPNSIDIERFPVREEREAEYDFIFIGSLIPLKRVDTIIKAFSKVNQKHPKTKLCVIGTGPLETTLKEQVNQLKITNQVDFIGYTTKVSRYVAKSKIALIASEIEGFPFSLIEGICSGLVPVTTPVGTIRDHIVDEENGLFFSVGNAEELADKMCRLTEDSTLYQKLRNASIKLRDTFSYQKATEIWDCWLRTIQ